MKVPENIFGSYDIRAIYPDEVNEDNLYQIAQAILHFYQKKLDKINVTVVTGKDMRLSVPKLYPVLKRALIDGGANVIDVGLVSTPSFYFSVLHLKADTGIQLTASHNPPEYTGLKMVMRDGDKIIKIGKPTGILDIKQYALDNVSLSNDGGSESKHEGIIKEEIEFAFKHIDPCSIKPLKVVADPANAMAITYLEPLFKRLPCKLIKMNFELDGTFPAHQPNPLLFHTLDDIRECINREGADLGIAFDGDGDRMFFIDENSEIVTGAQSTALVARELLKRYPNSTILYDIRYTMTPKAVVEENGGRSVITKVGHAFITKALHDNDGLYGGESSEHNFFKWTGGGESQMIMLLIILKAISDSGKSLSELVNEIVRSYESGEYNYETTEASKIIDELKDKYSDANISNLDGIAIEYDDWRFNVRLSNTEPLMRLNLEAKSENLMNRKLKEVQKFILEHNAKPKNH